LFKDLENNTISSYFSEHMKEIEFTDGERQAIIQLIDIAIKHPTLGGAKVAGAGSFLISKFVDDPVPEEGESDAEQVEEVEE
tara:strand:- start:863 stop:1108 length:246 start_codon:yes stop_codon:yes gene_type:complete